MPSTSNEAWLERVENLRTWRRSGQRAPHKPLLLLWALGRLQRGEPDTVSFAEAEAPLAALLDEFGPGRKTTPAYPFVHLASDGLWQATSKSGERLSPRDDRAGHLRASGALGGLEPDFAAAVLGDSNLFEAIVHRLLDDQFPVSLQGDVLAQVGIALGAEASRPRGGSDPTPRRRRDPAFREKVLMAYDRACAMCGFDAQLSSDAPGLEAAHVWWFNCNGPDETRNGLCLCSIHHKLLDRGVIGLTLEHTITVSQRFTARSSASEQMVLSLSGQPLAEPQPGFDAVEAECIQWHTEQVFKEPARQSR